MKKVILCLMLLLVVGCGTKSLVFNDVYNNVKDLQYNNELVFNDHETMTKEQLESIYQLDTSSMEEFLFVLPKGITNPNMYVIVKPVSGKTNIVKEDMKNFLTKYDNSWGVGEGAIPYFPEAVELINNRLERTYGNYLIYIVSSDNELIYKTITK